MKQPIGYGLVLVASLGFFLADALPQIQAMNAAPTASQTQTAAVVNATPTPTTPTAANTSAALVQLLNDQITGMVAPAKGAPQPQIQSNSVSLASLILERRDLMVKLASGDPRAFLAGVLPSATRSALPANLQSAVEQNATVNGTLQVFHTDDFVNETNDTWTYTILQSGQPSIDFHPSETISAVSGMTVASKGYSLGPIFVAPADPGHITLGPTPPLESIGPQRVLVFLLQYPGATVSHPFTPQAIHDYVFRGQFEKFYEEQSFGKVSFTGDVTDWISMNVPAANFCYGGGSTPTINSPEISSYISSHNIDLSKYNRLAFFMNHQLIGGGCSGVGEYNQFFNGKSYRMSSSWIGGIGSYTSPMNSQPFDWSYLTVVLSHEMGHALGLMHSNGWDCQDQSLYGNCQHIEYGNYFDTMGSNGAFATEFVAYYKNILGWLDPSQVVTINSSGSYAVHDLETSPTAPPPASSGAPVAQAVSGTASNPMLVIVNDPVTHRPYLAIDHRIGIGFDAKLNQTSYPSLASDENGLFVGRIILDPTPATERLLDMSPTTDGWYDDTQKVTLNSQQVFADRGHGIILTTGIVPVVPVPGPENIPFRVDIIQPQCSYMAPSESYPPSILPMNAGKAFYFSESLVNPDSEICPNAETYDYSFDGLPTGATWALMNSPLPAPPGQKIYPQFQMTYPATYPGGTFSNITFNAKSLLSGQVFSRQLYLLILPPLQVTRVSPTSAKVGTLVILSTVGLPLYQNTSILFSNNLQQSTWLTAQSGDGTTLSFVVPQTINDNLKCTPQGGCPSIPTPAGHYSVSVYSNNSTASIPFDVQDQNGTVPASLGASMGTPTLRLEYDSVGHESSLTATFPVDISAGPTDQEIVKSNAFFAQMLTSTGGYVSAVETYDRPAGTNDLGTFWGIPKNTTVHFIVTLKANPAKMFAGTYYAVLNRLGLGDSSGPVPPTYLDIPAPNTTPSVTIVGEVSPYIYYVSPTVVASGQLLSISGTRFDPTSNIVRLVNSSTGAEIDSTQPSIKDNSIIQFNVNAPAGNYTVQVVHPKNGQSNLVPLTIAVAGTQLITQPSPTPTSSASPSPSNSPSPSVTPTVSPSSSPTPSGSPHAEAAPVYRSANIFDAFASLLKGF